MPRKLVSERSAEQWQAINDTLAGLKSKDAVTRRMADTNLNEMYLASLTNDEFCEQYGYKTAVPQRVFALKYGINPTSVEESVRRKAMQLDGQLGEIYFRYTCKEPELLEALGFKPLELAGELEFIAIIGALLSGCLEEWDPPEELREKDKEVDKHKQKQKEDDLYNEATIDGVGYRFFKPEISNGCSPEVKAAIKDEILQQKLEKGTLKAKGKSTVYAHKPKLETLYRSYESLARFIISCR